MTSKRNARVVLREHLNHLYKCSRELRDYWTVGGRVHEPGEGFRVRRADEYPETKAENWDHAAEYADAMAKEWGGLAEWARLQAHCVRETCEENR
jgi:hypothetical protein